MKNFRSARALTGFTVRASDGEIGKVSELYFDDAAWEIRYVVVDTARWLPGRKVLLPTSAVTEVLADRRELRVALSREQVKGSPRPDTDMPIAVQRRAERKARHNWAVDLAGEALASVPEAFLAPGFEPVNSAGKPFDPHLRTTKVVTGLVLRADDFVVGRISDFIVDEETWSIRYVVVSIGDGRQVLLLPQFVREIRIEESAVVTDLPVGAIASCPALDPATMLTHRYEEEVDEHYKGYRDGARRTEAERS
ncbi:MAG: PRC-barrel domain-containing protein [Proteobacteria bacterium]|jgi:hypothetical protein|nr:PRC-barrel domain-containing protein [Pseudomonadota bacterium]